jgi:threonine/homoserine/homoserine lactone efflux protein
MDVGVLTEPWLFFVIVFGVVILPGMDMAFVIASALMGGVRSGLAAVAGIVLGGALHVVLTVVGVGIVFKTFPLAFNVLLVAGSAYIAWLGWQLLRSESVLNEISAAPPRTLLQTGGRAFATCMMNPKAYVFMLAVFPQFLRPQQGAIWFQALLLGLIIAATQVLVYGGYALGAARLGSWMRHHPRCQIWLARSIGVLLIVAAIWTGWRGWLSI